MPKGLLLVGPDTPPVEAKLARALGTGFGFQWERARWDVLGAERLAASRARLIVAAALPEASTAMGLFDRLAGYPIARPMLALLPADAADDAIGAATSVADDFVLWPAPDGELRHRVTRLLAAAGDDGVAENEVDAVSRRLIDELGTSQLIGRAPAFVRAVGQLPLIARNDVPVLITGETGTGKELCARAIHHLGRRRSFPFIAVDCGTIPDHLFENELFGHARGAFTDAHRDQRGLITMAEGGTLFLDEVDALSLAAQAKLLRLLQERTFRPLGADRFLRADVNVVTATNRDLAAAVRERHFRSDLFFRLNVMHVHLPPLRERVGDVALLTSHFLDLLTGARGGTRKSVSMAGLRRLTAYAWPGNVRELYNVLQRAVVLCETDQILPMHLATGGAEAHAAPLEGFRVARAAAIASFERAYVEDLLRKHCGNVTRAAFEAQKDRRVFGRLVKKYAIDRLTLAGRDERVPPAGPRDPRSPRA
ncbi:MAG TPA: sigma-54 dependent transcriptional regulator [Candidatus Binatia bacterium]|nr:sigma-54 dependent transcriptional regulator [Candidatus Binatia bacterium]